MGLGQRVANTPGKSESFEKLSNTLLVFDFSCNLLTVRKTQNISRLIQTKLHNRFQNKGLLAVQRIKPISIKKLAKVDFKDSLLLDDNFRLVQCAP